MAAELTHLEIGVGDAFADTELQRFGVDVGPETFPATLTLTSEGAAERDITVVVVGSSGDESVVARATTTFVPGPSRALVMWLRRVCLAEPCAAGMTCDEAVCVSDRREGSSLPLTDDVLGTDAGSPDVRDAGPEEGDGGASDGGDAGLDAEPCVATAELCDRLDNDCDGLTDEAVGNADVEMSFEVDGPQMHCGRCFNDCDCVAGACGGIRDIEAVVGSSCYAESGSASEGTLICSPRGPLSGLTADLIRVEAGQVASSADPGMLCFIRSGDGAVACVGDEYDNDAISGCTCAGRCLECPRTITGPASAAINAVTDLAVGRAHGCSVAAGALYCWGRNMRGQLGTTTQEGSISFRKEAEQVVISGVDRVAQVVAGDRFTCAREEGGERRVFCFGADVHGSLGRFSTESVNQDPLPVVDGASTPLVDVVDVSCAGGSPLSGSRNAPHCCVAHADGEVTCWGANDFGQLDGTSTGATRTPPTPLSRPSGMGPVREVEVGPAVSCAVTRDDEVWCWGDAGAIMQQSAGSGLTDPRRIVFDAPIPAIRDLSLSPGIADRDDAPVGFAMARAWTGEVYCWGANDGLQCSPTRGDVITPHRVTP